MRMIYYEPMFKSQCKEVGRGFKMYYAGNGCTEIVGSPEITLGDNVTIFDKTVFTGLKLFPHPRIVVGNNTYLGPEVRLFSAKEITIGSNCLIGSEYIIDNPGHAVYDVLSRLRPGGGTATIDDVRPVRIGDFCWLPGHTFVYPGVQLGDGVVAGLGTHIMKSVPPFCRIGGNPAKILRLIPLPEELRDVVGQTRFDEYRRIHKELRTQGYEYPKSR
jgi:acetyltransferase-like isoleucine patch superfamily enzyme